MFFEKACSKAGRTQKEPDLTKDLAGVKIRCQGVNARRMKTFMLLHPSGEAVVTEDIALRSLSNSLIESEIFPSIELSSFISITTDPLQR